MATPMTPLIIASAALLFIFGKTKKKHSAKGKSTKDCPSEIIIDSSSDIEIQTIKTPNSTINMPRFWVDEVQKGNKNIIKIASNFLEFLGIKSSCLTENVSISADGQKVKVSEFFIYTCAEIAEDLNAVKLFSDEDYQTAMKDIENWWNMNFPNVEILKTP